MPYSIFRRDMNEKAIVEALLERDPFVTRLFFHRNCRPLFVGLINRLAKGGVRWELDEVVDEVYMLLMEDDGRRLRTFQFESSLYQWIKVVALRHLLRKRGQVIELSLDDAPYIIEQDVLDESMAHAAVPSSAASDEEQRTAEARADVERLLARMPNQRYADVLRKLHIEGYSNEELAAQMRIRLPNLYNIKRRAMAQLQQLALAEAKA